MRLDLRDAAVFLSGMKRTLTKDPARSPFAVSVSVFPEQIHVDDYVHVYGYV
jgi:hypothetical protein